MSEDTVLVDTTAHVATITLNRPAAMNALSPRLVVELAQCWRELAMDDSVHAIVVTGAGDRAFCAGADLKLFAPLTVGLRAPEDEWDRQVLAEPTILDVTLMRGFDVGKPVIAAIQAQAVGGGMELVQATDLRVMASTATLQLKEVQWGLFPAGGSTVLLPRQLPWAIAMEMLLTGRKMSAEEALALGMVNRVTEPADVLPAAQELAAQIAALPPNAVQAIRFAARSLRSHTIEAGMAKEVEIALPVLRAGAAAEGLMAFAERPKRASDT